MGDVPGYIRKPEFTSGNIVDVLLHDHYPAPHRMQITGWPEYNTEQGHWEYVADAIAHEHRGMLGVRFDEHRPITTAQCGECGELFEEGAARAEMYLPSTEERLVVHAEPCAQVLERRGWELA